MDDRNRDREDADRASLSRVESARPTDPRVYLVEVIDGGNKPVTFPGRFLGRRLVLTGGGVSGDFTFDQLPGDIVFTCLNAVPDDGERLLIHRDQNHWVARRHGAPQPPPGDWYICVIARKCQGPTSEAGALAGATVTVMDGVDLIGTCETNNDGPQDGRCCVVVPHSGAYQVTVSHPDYPSETQTINATSGIPGPFGGHLFCLGGQGGELCVLVASCNGPWDDESDFAGATADFIQGGLTVASKPVLPYAPFGGINGRACACLPTLALTTVRIRDVPARFQTTEWKGYPGGCGSSSNIQNGYINLAKDRYEYNDRYPILKPATGYKCSGCFGCPFPIPQTLHTTNPYTGVPVILTDDLADAYVGQWWGTNTMDYPGCPYGCPPTSVDTAYLFTCCRIYAAWKWRIIPYEAFPGHFIPVWCPGNVSHPMAYEKGWLAPGDPGWMWGGAHYQGGPSMSFPYPGYGVGPRPNFRYCEGHFPPPVPVSCAPFVWVTEFALSWCGEFPTPGSWMITE